MSEIYWGWARVGFTEEWRCVCVARDKQWCWDALKEAMPHDLVNDCGVTAPISLVVLPEGMTPVGLKRKRRKH